MFSLRLNALCSVIKDCEYTEKKQTVSEHQAFELAYQMLLEVHRKKKRVYLLGNGGSAGIASHFSIDILNVLEIPSFTFYDPNQMSCIANDYGYEEVFSFPLQRSLQEEDLVIAISSSGMSPNILRGAYVTKQKQAKLLTFSGFSSQNLLRQKGDLNFWVPSHEYGLVETAHFFFLHTLIDGWKSHQKQPSLVAHA